MLAILFVVVCADLAVANRGLNPTADAATFSPPAWYVESAGPARVYLGGRFRGFMNTNDPDGTPPASTPADLPDIRDRMRLNAELPMAPSGWQVREALSYDLPALRPAEYETAMKEFEQSGPEVRATFLRRAGVRRCVLPIAEGRPYAAVADVPDWGMRVYDCHPQATRVVIASAVDVALEPADLAWQQRALFDDTVADDRVRLPRVPAEAGLPSTPEPPSARIVEDGTTHVTVEAALPQSGLLVLRDSYDPSWRADVDGRPAEIVRANGLYRAVALPAGRHVIRFSYRPRDFVFGLIISGITAMLLAWRTR
jgi:hypothetical protein